jgi:hypothetical protein
MINSNKYIILLTSMIILSNSKSQIIGFTPYVDTLYTAGGCTPTCIIASYIKGNANLDTIKILPDWNTHFWSGNYYSYDQVFFIIKDSLNLYQSELWVETIKNDFEVPTFIPFDSVIFINSRNYFFKLILKENNIIFDSLSQFCIAVIGIGVNDKVKSGVIKNHLFTNYPNPFNQVTIIKYNVLKKSRIQIIIYDITGRLIDSLLNEIVFPGFYTLRWQTNNLTSGQYFIILKTEDNILTRKCLLLK